MDIKEIRLKTKYSQSAAAALAKCSPNSWRLYEANPAALTPLVRAACDAAAAKLAAMLQDQTA
jgi:hypothetical protein